MPRRRRRCCRAPRSLTRRHPHRRHRPESRRPRSRSWMRRRARPFSRRRDVLSATGSTIASTKPPQPGSVRADARPIHAPAPIGETVSQFLYWARNMRNESCGRGPLYSRLSLSYACARITTDGREAENRMRELFDEVSGKSPLDPEEAVRRATRGLRRKRFYANAGVVEARDGFAITLDDKPVRTPSGRALVAPSREIADAISAEWDAQKEIIDPLTMPFTRFANSVVDAVVDRVEAVADDIAKYLGSDLLFYRAGHPE